MRKKTTIPPKQNRTLLSNQVQNQFAIVGFVLTFIAPILGIVFSCIAFHKTKYGLYNKRKLAIAGIIIGIICLATRLFFWFGTGVAIYYDLIQ